MNKTYYAMAMACLLLVSCKNEGEKTVEEIKFSGDTVTVAATSPILSKLSTEIVTEETVSNEFRTVGTVQAETGRYAEVGVPFDGRVSSTKVMLGTRVRAGQTLFELSSPDFIDACKTYFQNKRNYLTANAGYERKRSLQDAGIVSQKELDEAKAETENYLQEIEASVSMFKAYGLDPDNINPGQAMQIVAPIDGEVVRFNVTPGSFIKSDCDALLTIADLRRVWVTAQVKERFVCAVSKGTKVEVYTEAEPETPISGTVLNVGNLVDEQTRSVQVIVACDNPELKLKHGMYVSVHFFTDPKDAIVVPSTAIFQGETSNYVFVPTAEGNVFVRRRVTIGEHDVENVKVVVNSGLQVGESIVSAGGLFLNN